MQFPPAAPASSDYLSNIIRDAHARSFELDERVDATVVARGDEEVARLVSEHNPALRTGEDETLSLGFGFGERRSRVGERSVFEHGQRGDMKLCPSEERQQGLLL